MGAAATRPQRPEGSPFSLDATPSVTDAASPSPPQARGRGGFSRKQIDNNAFLFEGFVKAIGGEAAGERGVGAVTARMLLSPAANYLVGLMPSSPNAGRLWHALVERSYQAHLARHNTAGHGEFACHTFLRAAA